jgi:hypothetical protein
VTRAFRGNAASKGEASRRARPVPQSYHGSVFISGKLFIFDFHHQFQTIGPVRHRVAAPILADFPGLMPGQGM